MANILIQRATQVHPGGERDLSTPRRRGRGRAPRHKQFTMQAVAVAIAKATWAWVRGKCEEAMREVLGAGRGVQAGEVETPAMAAEAGRETRRGAESDEESDGCDGAQDSARVQD